MKLTALEAFADNDRWMIDQGPRAGAVDPGEPEPPAAALDSRGLELAAILVTRHRSDAVAADDASGGRHRAGHAGGNVAAAMRTWTNDFR